MADKTTLQKKKKPHMRKDIGSSGGERLRKNQDVERKVLLSIVSWTVSLRLKGWEKTQKQKASERHEARFQKDVVEKKGKK